MSALAVDSEEIDTLVYKRSDGKYRGWKTELLVEQLITKLEERFLLCSYCEALMRDACLLEEEGKQVLRCITCIPEGVTRQPALMSRDSINEKLIRCPLSERGCQWGDTVSRAIQHMSECGFVCVLCPLKCVESEGERSGKVVRVERRQVAEHEREYCSHRVLKCELCDQSVTACEMNLHMGECEGVPVVCPNGCEAAGETGSRQVKRGDMPLHRAECPLQSVQCPYWEQGCGEEMERRQLEIHEREFMHIHFKLAMKELKEIKEIKQMQIESNDRIQLLEEQNAELKETIFTHVLTGGLEWKVDLVRQKIEKKEITYSEPFFVGLYMCQCKIECCNNTGNVGCFICIMKGQYDDKLKWPFLCKFKFVLLKQNTNQEDYIRSGEITNNDLEKFPDSFQRPTNIRNNGFGSSSFITNAEILSDKYCRDDAINLQINVEQLPSF